MKLSDYKVRLNDKTAFTLKEIWELVWIVTDEEGCFKGDSEYVSLIELLLADIDRQDDYPLSYPIQYYDGVRHPFETELEGIQNEKDLDTYLKAFCKYLEDKLSLTESV